MPIGSRVPSIERLRRGCNGAGRLFAFLIGCLAFAPAPAVNFQFIYDDANGTGFLDLALGTQRQQALAEAAAVWGRLIMSSHADEVIIVRASFKDYAAGSGTLASAKPNFYYSEFSSFGPKFGDTNYPKALADHLNRGDLSNRHDITIEVNRAANFYFGNATPAPTQFDFISVAAHEIGHGLGFTSSFREDGDYGIYGDGTFFPIMLPEMLPKPYDQFLTSGAGGPKIIDLGSGAREAAMTSNNVFWSGANAITGNGGNPVALFAPSSWDSGSSISHLNDPATLMSMSIGPGEMRRTPSAVERGILRDMGWTISVTASELTWSGAASNRIGQAGNWTTGVAPLPQDSFIFGVAGPSGTTINVDVALYSLGRILFTPDAPAYTFNFASGTDTTFTGAGIVNQSARMPSLNLATGSVMDFENAASAANASFRLAGGDTAIVMNPPVGYYFDRSVGARVAFRNTASAANANLHVGGGAGNGGIKAQVIFGDSANAADAVIVNEAGRSGPGELYNGIPTTQFGFGGETRFEDTASAGRARITNQGIARNLTGLGTGGYTTFADRSNAANAVIDNLGGEGLFDGGVTEFVDDAAAGQANITNRFGRFRGGGRTAFFHRSTADRATITNVSDGNFGGGSHPGWTAFRDFSTAGSATIINQLGGRTEFFDDSSGGTATIRLTPWGASDGNLAFRQRATAGNATIVSVVDGLGVSTTHVVVEFNDTSSAGSATFRADAGAAPLQLNFRGNSSAGSATFQDGAAGQNRIEFYNSSSAGTSTLRMAANAILGFYDNTSAGGATINTAGWLIASSNASLGTANITIAGNDATTNRIETLKVEQRATVADANILLLGGSALNARGAEMVIRNNFRAANERVGNATIAAMGGLNGGQGASVALQVDLPAPGLRLITEGNARFRMQPLFQPFGAGVLQIGSIAGSGQFQIDGGLGVEFTTGYLDTSTTVSGVISGSFRRLTKVGAGTLSLDGVNTYNALTSVDAGALAINGSIRGDVVVNAGATLMGTGTIGGGVTVNDGGILAPGLSPGTLRVGSLNLLAGGVLAMEFGANQRDLLIVAADAFLAGTLEFKLIDGYLPKAGDVVVLFDVGGVQQGAFSNVLFPTLAPGFQYQFTFDGDNFAMMALNNAQPVPEPASIWMLLCGILVIGGWRLRVRRGLAAA